MKDRNTTKCRPSKNHPEILDFVAGIIAVSQTYPVEKLAKSLGVSKQALQTHANNRKEKKA